MQGIELNSCRIVERARIETCDLSAQRNHAGRDPELREQCQRQHKADQDVARSKDVRRAIRYAAVGQRGNQEYDAGADGDPVQFGEQVSDERSGEQPSGQQMKRRWSHDREENDSANPDDEREKHKIAKEGHDGNYSLR